MEETRYKKVESLAVNVSICNKIILKGKTELDFDLCWVEKRMP